MVQVHSGLPNLRSKFEEVANDGAIAQLGERLLCTQEVSGSIPLSSTINVRLMTTPEYIHECIVQYLLFNNPEQAENLKEQLLA